MAVLRAVRAAGSMTPASVNTSFSTNADARGPLAKFTRQLIAGISFKVGFSISPCTALIGDVHQLVIRLLLRNIMRLRIVLNGRLHFAGASGDVRCHAVIAALRHAVAVAALLRQLVHLLEATGRADVVHRHVVK